MSHGVAFDRQTRGIAGNGTVHMFGLNDDGTKGKDVLVSEPRDTWMGASTEGRDGFRRPSLPH